MAKIDAKYLDGLVFNDVEKKKGTKDGRPVTQNIPVERPLTADDVLDWKDCGDTVVIVAADGRKHTVPKKAQKAGKGDEK